MTDTSRVQRWRESKRQHGLKAVTIWLTAEEELRLKDLALQWHCSPLALVQQALAQCSPQTSPRISTATDISQIRGARSQGSNPWQTQVMALGVSRSSSIFLWTWSPLSAIKRPAV